MLPLGGRFQEPVTEYGVDSAIHRFLPWLCPRRRPASKRRS
jgi:hypothetical protein